MKKTLSFLFMLALTFGLLLGPSNISSAADNNHLTIEQVKELKAKLLDIGVYKKDIPKLIKKLENGQVWDSMNPDVLSKIPEEKLTATLSDPVKVYRFNDGSVYKSEIGKNVQPGMMTPMSSTCGSGYCNYYDYKVSASTGVITASFLADFSITYGTYYADHISNVYNSYIEVIGGDYSNPDLAVVRAYEDTYTGQQAYARLQFHVSGLDGNVGSTCYLNLYVGDDTYNTSHLF